MSSMVRRAGLLALAALPFVATAGATGVEVARSEAEANVKSPAGKRYEGSLIGKVDEWLRPAVEKCATQAAQEELISFDALIRVGADGKAEEVVYRAGDGRREVRGADVPGPDLSEAAGALVVGEGAGADQIGADRSGS
jgi:hypothetical protein